MKRILLLVLLGGFFLADTSAQNKIELTGFYGYNLNTRIRTYYGDYKLHDNPNYGGILSVGIAPDLYVELMYNRSDTKMNYYYLSQNQPLDVSTEYYQVGGLREIPMGGAVVPFGVGTIGLTRFNMKETLGDFYAGDKFAMSITIGGGAKILLGEVLGIRLQARMGLPMSFNGLWIGTGGSGASFYVPVAQFDFTAGVFLRLGT